jgi:hypothetical protein
MKNKRIMIVLLAGAFVVSVPLVLALIAHLSFITVTNDSGQSLAGVTVFSDGFELPCGSLEPGESCRFLRWANDSCGLVLTGRGEGGDFLSSTGFSFSNARGSRIRIAIQPNFAFRLTVTPDSEIVAPPVVSTRRSL